MSEADASAPQYPGDPRHQAHAEYLSALGAATYSAAGLAGAAFELLRVHHRVSSAEMYDDPLGRLVSRLNRALDLGSPLPELDAFISELNAAKDLRNDLIHAMPVRDGLYRRTGRDLSRVVEFYTIESLCNARAQFDAVKLKGNQLLYFDGGRAVEAWGRLPPSEA